MAGLNAAKAPKSNGGGNRVEQPIIPAGTYPARVAQIIDLGMQPQQPYQGQEKPPAHEIMITYELVDEFMVDEDGKELEDKPRWISETMPLRHIDSDLAKSTKRYKALDPQMEHGGDFSELLGAPCNVLIITKVVKSGKNAGKERNYVDSISAMRPRDAQRTAELQNEAKMFTLEEPDLTIFRSLPEWLQGKIQENLEFNGSALQAALDGGGKVKEEPEDEYEEADRVAAEEAQAEDSDEDDKPW